MDGRCAAPQQRDSAAGIAAPCSGRTHGELGQALPESGSPACADFQDTVLRGHGAGAGRKHLIRQLEAFAGRQNEVVWYPGFAWGAPGEGPPKAVTRPGAARPTRLVPVPAGLGPGPRDHGRRRLAVIWACRVSHRSGSGFRQPARGVRRRTGRPVPRAEMPGAVDVRHRYGPSSCRPAPRAVPGGTHVSRAPCTCRVGPWMGTVSGGWRHAVGPASSGRTSGSTPGRRGPRTDPDGSAVHQLRPAVGPPRADQSVSMRPTVRRRRARAAVPVHHWQLESAAHAAVPPAAMAAVVRVNIASRMRSGRATDRDSPPGPVTILGSNGVDCPGADQAAPVVAHHDGVGLAAGRGQARATSDVRPRDRSPVVARRCRHTR